MFDLRWEGDREEKERETGVWVKKRKEDKASICHDSSLLF
jgi:hypothetical protein